MTSISMFSHIRPFASNQFSHSQKLLYYFVNRLVDSMASSNAPKKTQALNDYEEDGSIADLLGKPVAPVVPPTKSTPEDVRNEFYDKIRFLVDQQSREDEEEPDSSDDNDESPDDPDLYSDDVQNAFAAYEQRWQQPEINENEPYNETLLTTDELQEQEETYHQMCESWNYFALEYPLVNCPAEMLLNDLPSQMNNLNVEAEEFFPAWLKSQPIDAVQEEIDPNSKTSSQNDENCA